jgi:ArsR family transcriptional regulator
MDELFKVLGDVNRLRLINLLMEAELCVCEIEVMVELSQSNASRHLKKLRDQNIILSSKDAQWIHYRINRGFVEENSELIAYLSRRFEEEPVFINDLKRWNKYRENGLNCSVIREDKDRVLNLIQL